MVLYIMFRLLSIRPSIMQCFYNIEEEHVRASARIKVVSIKKNQIETDGSKLWQKKEHFKKEAAAKPENVFIFIIIIIIICC